MFEILKAPAVRIQLALKHRRNVDESQWPFLYDSFIHYSTPVYPRRYPAQKGLPHGHKVQAISPMPPYQRFLPLVNAGEICVVERDAALKGGGSPKGLTPQDARPLPE